MVRNKEGGEDKAEYKVRGGEGENLVPAALKLKNKIYDLKSDVSRLDKI